LPGPESLMIFPGALRRDPAVARWMELQRGDLGRIALRWLDIMRNCGDDVRELLHDGHPTACVGDGAFAYVDAFREHVNVGFFRGAELVDPSGLLRGSGKLMRHVKIIPGRALDERALEALVADACLQVRTLRSSL
jgi:hypothetical protein